MTKSLAEKRAQANYATKNREKLKDKNLEYRKRHPKTCLLRSAKSRALKRNIVCTITEDDFSIPEICPILNIPLIRHFGTPGGKKNSPSLDRINPELGYVPGNVWVISQQANAMKSDASVQQLKQFALWVNTTYE